MTKEQIEQPKVSLTVEDLQILLKILNQPMQMDLQTANRLIELSNKLTTMISEAE